MRIKFNQQRTSIPSAHTVDVASQDTKQLCDACFSRGKGGAFAIDVSVLFSILQNRCFWIGLELTNAKAAWWQFDVLRLFFVPRRLAYKIPGCQKNDAVGILRCLFWVRCITQNFVRWPESILFKECLSLFENRATFYVNFNAWIWSREMGFENVGRCSRALAMFSVVHSRSIEFGKKLSMFRGPAVGRCCNTTNLCLQLSWRWMILFSDANMRCVCAISLLAQTNSWRGPKVEIHVSISCRVIERMQALTCQSSQHPVCFQHKL